ncbi:MAG: hypothetical protein ACJ8DI_25895 [Ktedonobacteraceae bacterium]
MNDPRTLTLFTVVFILLGIFNIFSGRRRMREARARGQQVAWYRQINILTGLEFIFLSLIFMISLNSNGFPSSVRAIVGIFYLVLLLLSAVLAGFVIRQAILNTRAMRNNQSSQAIRNGTISRVNEARENELTPEQRAANIQHRRERRQKASAARRRRGSKV